MLSNTQSTSVGIPNYTHEIITVEQDGKSLYYQPVELASSSKPPSGIPVSHILCSPPESCKTPPVQPKSDHYPRHPVGINNQSSKMSEPWFSHVGNEMFTCLEDNAVPYTRQESHYVDRSGPTTPYAESSGAYTSRPAIYSTPQFTSNPQPDMVWTGNATIPMPMPSGSPYTREVPSHASYFEHMPTSQHNLSVPMGELPPMYSQPGTPSAGGAPHFAGFQDYSPDCSSHSGHSMPGGPMLSPFSKQARAWNEQQDSRTITVSPRQIRLIPTPSPPLSNFSSSVGSFSSMHSQPSSTHGGVDPQSQHMYRNHDVQSNMSPHMSVPQCRALPDSVAPYLPVEPTHYSSSTASSPSFHNSSSPVTRSYTYTQGQVQMQIKGQVQGQGQVQALLPNHPTSAAWSVHGNDGRVTKKSQAQRREQDEFLVSSKLRGMTYREIRNLGKFTEAESTLRGRFRTLTKNKEARVRKPEWYDVDVKLLKEAVHKMCDERAIESGKIPWKRVAEYIANNGGSYHFGNATCRKKWDELV